LGLDAFQNISAKINWHALLGTAAHRSWQRLRHLPDARYISLLCQRVLWREPYSRRYQGDFNLTFDEQITQSEDLCWGSASYLIAALALQSFHQTAWFTDLNAMQTQMQCYYSPFDVAQISPLARLEVSLDQSGQNALVNEGFTLLSENRYSRSLRLESAHAFYKPPAIQDEQQKDNAWIACLLPYLLCACRFAHYLKIIGREKVGSMLTTDDLETYLQNWLYQYCGKADYHDEARMAKFPLASGRIHIEPHPIDPTHYICKMDLKPNCRVENIDARLRLVSAINRGG
jgi:type VI secretion system protein ImpD